MKNEPKYGLLLFLVAVHALYFIAAARIQGIYLVDSFGYLQQSVNIVSYNTWYAEDWNAPLLVDYFSIRPPLYAWLIAGIQLISGDIFVLLLFQNLLSLLNLWMVYRFALEQGCNHQRTAVVIMIASLLYPAQFIHANFVMTEIVFQTLLLSAVLSLIRCVQSPSWKESIRLSLLLCLCLLTKPVSVLLPVIAVVLLLPKIYYAKRWRMLLPLLFPVVVFHAVCLNQQHATGYYHYSSIKSINQLKYNARYTLVNAEGEEAADSTISAVMKVADQKPAYGERLSYMNSEANRLILKHPGTFIRLYIKGVVAFFIDPGRFDLYHFFAVDEQGSPGLLHELNTKGLSAFKDLLAHVPAVILLLLLVNLCWNILLFAVCCYFVTLRQVPVAIRIVLFIVVAYIAAASGPVGVSRYRVPVFPEMLLAAVFACHYLPFGKSAHYDDEAAV
jgi:hypothetical protein